MQCLETMIMFKNFCENKPFNQTIDWFSDDITMPIVWFLLQIVVKFAHLNQW